jgi:hypothetical protein
MSKIKISIVSACFIVGVAGTAGSLRAQSTPRFEYLRAFAYGERQQVSDIRRGPTVRVGKAYRACIAAENEWNCRDFARAEAPDSPERKMLSTLGDEGWELVSVVQEADSQFGVTYLFKRAVR